MMTNLVTAFIMQNMNNVLENPLRKLREGVTTSRADFCRRHKLGYQSVTLAEIGLVPRPSNFIRVLASLTGRPAADLLAQHQEWLSNTAAAVS